MLRMTATAALLVMIGTTAMAKTDAALRAALRKGYTGEKAKCYADVSRRYYRPGTLSVPGRSAASWHVDLWNQCRISR